MNPFSFFLFGLKVRFMLGRLQFTPSISNESISSYKCINCPANDQFLSIMLKLRLSYPAPTGGQQIPDSFTRRKQYGTLIYLTPAD